MSRDKSFQSLRIDRFAQKAEDLRLYWEWLRRLSGSALSSDEYLLGEAIEESNFVGVGGWGCLPVMDNVQWGIGEGTVFSAADYCTRFGKFQLPRFQDILAICSTQVQLQSFRRLENVTCNSHKIHHLGIRKNLYLNNSFLTALSWCNPGRSLPFNHSERDPIWKVLHLLFSLCVVWSLWITFEYVTWCRSKCLKLRSK